MFYSLLNELHLSGMRDQLISPFHGSGFLPHVIMICPCLTQWKVFSRESYKQSWKAAETNQQGILLAPYPACASNVLSRPPQLGSILAGQIEIVYCDGLSEKCSP